MGEKNAAEIDPDMARKIARNLKLFRELTANARPGRKPISQEEVARQVGCSTRLVATIEAAAADDADPYSPNIVIASRMVTIYGKTLNDLLLAQPRR